MRKSERRSVAAWIIALTACCVIRAATAAEVAEASPPQEGAVEVEVFTTPFLKELGKNAYPLNEGSNGYEGWVTLSFMVDPRGKAYEISVMDSLGGEAFEKSAIRAIENGTFEPAKLGSTAVHSVSQLKVLFAMRDMAKEASERFVFNFRGLRRKINAGDRPGADALLPKINATNLYEDAYRNLVLYEYHKKWGTEDQQYADLKAAIAYEGTERYLGRQAFTTALAAMLVLEVKRQEFGEALETWEKLAPIAPKPLAQAWQPIIAEVVKLQSSDAPVRLAGEISKNTSWFRPLFRRRFQVAVLSGRVFEIKLRCDKGYVFFRYEAGVEYTVGKRDGECSLELIGEPGTKFELIQT